MRAPQATDQLVEIVPEGLDQKTDALQRIPGKLERATNVEFDKTGALNLRRGYSRQPLGSPVGPPGVNLAAAQALRDEVFLQASTYDDELLLLGYDTLYALGSRSGNLGGAERYVYRGPLNRGTVRLQHVAVSGLTDQIDAVQLTQLAVFASYDQCDVASLQANGHTYRCYSFRNAARNRIDAVCFVELEHGQDVEVFRNTVATGTEVDDTGGTRVDCPKIIAVGTTFVVHWIQGTVTGGSMGAQNLWRATLNMEAVETAVTSGWTSQGSIATHDDALYDAQPVTNSTGVVEFIVVHKWTSGTDVQIRRHTGFGWGNTAWNQLANTGDIAPRVLCCSCNSSDSDVVFSYQGEPLSLLSGQLRTGQVSYATGLGFASINTFPDAPFDEWGQVGHARTGSNAAVVVAEGWLAGEAEPQAPSLYHHGVAYRAISTNLPAVVGTEHWTLNVAMISRPFAYQSARELDGAEDPAVNVYVGLSFKSVGSASAVLSTWDQRSYFLANLDFAHWELHDTGLVRARPIANLGSNGSADARVSGSSPAAGASAINFTKRMNHISSVSGAPIEGPDVKTRTVAATIFSRITQRRITDAAYNDSTSEFIPTSSGVVGYRLHLEEPWIRHRDPTDPAEPSRNFRGAYPWTQYQSVKAGRCAFLSGGTPSLYDGHAVVEVGFPWYPEITEITSFAGEGGMEVGTRWWTATYEWRDSAGQIHRSRPAKPVRYTIVDEEGEDADVVRLHIRALNVSLKDSVHYPVQGPINVVVWRTEADGQIFYRLHGSDLSPYRIEDTPINDPNAYEIVVDDARPDAQSGVPTDTLDLARSDQLPYNFASGVSSSFLPVRPPASHACCIWQGRVWLASSEDMRELWYSAEILPAPGDTYTVAPEFHFENRFTLPELGEVIALQPMEDELVVFTRDGVYKLVGQGNSLGSANSTYQLSVVHEGTGSINPRCLVLGPPGVFFQSAKGVYLYGRGRELDYLSAGASIEDEIRDAGNVRSATLLEDRHQIRFAGNRRPLVDQVWTLEVIDAGPGIYQIFGLSDTIAWESDGGSSSDIADGLVAEIVERLGTTLAGEVEAAEADGSFVIITLVQQVELELSGTSMVATLEQTITHRPCVWIYDYFHRLWSRADLTAPTSDMLSRAVTGGTAWRGALGEQLHVVVCSGCLLLERATTDASPYADESSAGALVGYPFDVALSWVHVAGVAGLKRVREIGVQMTKPAAGPVSIDASYDLAGDYDSAVDETFDLASPSPAFVLVKPRVQKLSAFTIRLYEGDATPTPGNRLGLKAFVFVAMIKNTPRRVALAQIGT